MPLIADSVTCQLCGANNARLVDTMRRKPPGETDFGIPPDKYIREIWQCQACSVFFTQHDLFTDRFYREQYNRATYQHDLVGSYERVRGLPESASDNRQRVRRVTNLHATSGKQPQASMVLDVGSGLCVFLAELRDLGFRCHAIDPDPLAAEHAFTCANVDYAHAGTLKTFPLTDVRYDIVSINKVLEHVPDPVGLLSAATQFLKQDGFLYLEVPDGQGALDNSTVCDREEFFIEHETVFTEASTCWLVERAGLQVIEMQSIHEPSDKYTIYAFCSADN